MVAGGLPRIELVPIALEDFLLTAEAVLGIDAASLLAVTKLGSAESALAAPDASFGGVDFYPDPAQRAAVLCSRLVRNHPLPDGNKRVALLLMLEYIETAGLIWAGPSQDEVADTIERLAARELTEEAFTSWVARHAKAQ